MKLDFFKLGLILVQVYWTISSVTGFPSSTFDYCCEIGRQWHEHNSNSCPTHPTSDAQSNTQSACSLVIDVCCLAEHRTQLCLKGQQMAVWGQSCMTAVPEETKECCSCCKLGSMVFEAGLPCEIPHQYGSECRASFVRCCSNQTLNLAKTISVVMETGTTTETLSVQADALESFDPCDRNPCHQLCRPKHNNAMECYCRYGYRLSGDGRTCGDINECSDVELRHNCTTRERCVNTFGGFRCQPVGGRTADEGEASSISSDERGGGVVCPDGHQWNRRNRRCEDVDECTSARHRCVPGTTCVNSRGSYRCVFTSDLTPISPNSPLSPSVRPLMTPPIVTSPRPIYNPWRTQPITIARHIDSAHEARKRPTDSTYLVRTRAIDSAYEIRTRPTDSAHLARTRLRSRPHHRQTTSALQATGRCGAGYRMSHATGQCEDIDECQMDGGGCPMSNMVCRNTVGSFACTCSTGYLFNPRSKVCEDVDECRTRRHDCMSYETCYNTIGSFVCRSEDTRGNCSHGYTTDPITKRCTDIDECSQPRKRCPSSGSICINTPGSFRCQTKSCDRGTRIDETGNCVDIDECEESRGICRTNEECKNTVGSYVCRSTQSCGIGYELNRDGNNCEDIDECRRGRHSCNGPLMSCVNRPGTYTCQCQEGYQMNHATHSCEDIDECHKFGGHVCAQNARCENTAGSFRCICQEGFELEPNSKYCNDVNECDRRHGLCEHSCRNTWGSYYCTCNDGYQLSRDGRTCSDIDECGLWMETGRTTDVCLGICHNIPGSYLCTCPTGYKMSTDGRTCQDVDECVLGLSRCYDPDEVCLNTGGGYECRRIICPTGFIKTPRFDSQMTPARGRRAPSVWTSNRAQRGGQNVFAGSLRGHPSSGSPSSTPANIWRPVPTNVLRGVVAQPILFLSNEDSGVVCQKVECRANDIPCILNLTKSVQWQHVSLPTIPVVSGPTDVINVQTIAYSVHPNNEFKIVAGNDAGLFDVIRQTGFTDRGVVRLLRPISGPAEYTLTLRMDNYNRQHILISQHIAHIVIVVSRYRF